MACISASADIKISVISALIILAKMNVSYKLYWLFAFVIGQMTKEHMGDNIDVSSNSTYFQRHKTVHAVNLLGELFFPSDTFYIKESLLYRCGIIY